MLLQELFATPYFSITQDDAALRPGRACRGPPGHRARSAGSPAKLEVVLPVSFFERAGQAFFNSVAVIDADGAFSASIARATSPTRRLPGEVLLLAGDTGFRVWDTASRASAWASAGTSGSRSARAAWRCRAPRCCCIPTAIGSDPPAPDGDSRDRWQLVQRGHAIANAMPVVASNRIGAGVGHRRRAEHPLLRLVVHRRRDRRPSGRGVARPRRGRHGHRRPRRRPVSTRGLERSSATGGRSCTAPLLTLDGEAAGREAVRSQTVAAGCAARDAAEDAPPVGGTISSVRALVVADAHRTSSCPPSTRMLSAVEPGGERARRTCRARSPSSRSVARSSRGRAHGEPDEASDSVAPARLRAPCVWIGGPSSNGRQTSSDDRDADVPRHHGDDHDGRARHGAISAGRRRLWMPSPPTRSDRATGCATRRWTRPIPLPAAGLNIRRQQEHDARAG